MIKISIYFRGIKYLLFIKDSIQHYNIIYYLLPYSNAPLSGRKNDHFLRRIIGNYL